MLGNLPVRVLSLVFPQRMIVLSARSRCLRKQAQVTLARLRSMSSTPAEPVVLVRAAEGVARITLNSTKTRNALSSDFMTSISTALAEVGIRQDVSAVILQAKGPAFSAGHDLKELRARQNADDSNALAAIFRRCSELMMEVQELPIPVLAVVQGLATAAGAQLVASCDMVYAARSARFCTPGVNIGLFCSTPGVAISRSLPAKVAAEALFTGREYTADEMLRAGLVTRVFDDAELDAEVGRIAAGIASKPREVLVLGKRALRQQRSQTTLRQAYEVAEDAMCANLAAPACKEGIAAFIEKRRPTWAAQQPLH